MCAAEWIASKFAEPTSIDGSRKCSNTGDAAGIATPPLS